MIRCKSSYLGESTQPLGPFFLWQCIFLPSGLSGRENISWLRPKTKVGSWRMDKRIMVNRLHSTNQEVRYDAFVWAGWGGGWLVIVQTTPFAAISRLEKCENGKTWTEARESKVGLYTESSLLRSSTWNTYSWWHNPRQQKHIKTGVFWSKIQFLALVSPLRQAPNCFEIADKLQRGLCHQALISQQGKMFG